MIGFRSRAEKREAQRRRDYSEGWNAALDAVGWDVVNIRPEQQIAGAYQDAAVKVNSALLGLNAELRRKAAELERDTNWRPVRTHAENA